MHYYRQFSCHLLLSPVAYILGRKVGPTPAMWFTFAILLYTTILVINAALSGTVEEHYPWTEQFGEFGFLLDGLSISICNNDLCTVYNLGNLFKTIHDSQIP